jgi:hypothetical protein
MTTRGDGEVVDSGDATFLDDGAEVLVDGDDGGESLQLRRVKWSEALAKMGDRNHRSSELTGRRGWQRWWLKKLMRWTVSDGRTRTGGHQVGGAASPALDSKWRWCGGGARHAATIKSFSRGRQRHGEGK